MQQRLAFYAQTLSRWIPDRTASILVVAGGRHDRDVLHELGFQNVVISNIDPDIPASEVAPYAWSKQDVEALDYPDAHYQYVVIHDGLHHCRSPHQALLQMYRVAKTAVIAFEPPDTPLVRLMQKVGLAQVYECTAVASHHGEFGGVSNTAIPNYIYRWTEREVEQVVQSYAPQARHRFHYAYGMDAPVAAFIGRSWLKRLVIAIAKPAYRVFAWCLPKWQNLFAFMVEKPDLPRDRQPWLVLNEGQELRLNPTWKQTR